MNWSPSNSQELLPIEESYKLLEQVTKIRIFGHNLEYNHNLQEKVDKYALSLRLTKQYAHSSENYENICMGEDYTHFITQWKMSPGHRKNMRRWRHRSMTARFSKVGDTYYGVVQFYRSNK